jgi:multidrug efflux system membrane fusion protein
MKRPRWLHLPRSRSGRIIFWVIVALVLVLVVWIVIARLTKKKPAPPPPPPVTIAVAQGQAVPIILRGLGQVQAFNTFTAKSRVDGNIVEIGYREGSLVKAGDLLVRIDPRPYRAMLADKQALRAKDEAQLADARIDLARDATLLPQGLASRQDYDRQLATVRQLAATVRSDAAQIEEARLNLTYTAVRAPFSGRAGQRLVDLGNLVSASGNNALVVLTQIQPIFVSFTLPELDIQEIVRAQREGPVRIDAYDRDDRQRIAEGTLEVLDNTVDAGSGTVRLKARFANDDGQLWPGAFVNAHVVTSVRVHGITIPAGAVQMGPNGRFVFRIDRTNHARVVAVQVGQIEQGRALVDNGLAAGDRIIVDGSFGLSPGDQVRVTSTQNNAPATDTLDLTGRTRTAPSTTNGGGGEDRDKQKKQKGPKEEQPPPKHSTAAQPTEVEEQQQVTPSGGRMLNGNEGPGGRTPLPDTRQVPQPPLSKDERKRQQDSTSGH